MTDGQDSASDASRSQQFMTLYERHARALFAWANLRIGERLRARLEPDDLVQEVCFRAFLRFSTYDASRPFRGWLLGIANNVLREALVNLNRAPVAQGRLIADSSHLLIREVIDDATSVSRRIARDEGLRTFLERLGKLTDDDRKLLVYRGLEGLSHSRVAELLEISASACEKRWQRLVTQLKTDDLSPDLLEP